MKEMYKAYYKSDIGVIEIQGNEEGIFSIDFVKEEVLTGDTHPSLKECIVQLDEYFKGTRREFSVKLVFEGTRFQKRVWEALIKIPYGTTVSYGYIAAASGSAKGARAVGNANNNNRIAIIIPCHRVIGSNGKLTGYASGIWRKKWLLEHERNNMNI